MKKIITNIVLLLAAMPVLAQWQNKGFTHQGNARQYRVYKPANYNPSNPASLVITLHGLGDNMTNFSNIGFNYIADTANIIVVVPQAMTDGLISSTAWNSGAGFMGYYPNSTINDVAFINTLIDTIKTNYVINANRVYACGFSMGGFMTNRLAVELNTKFTAFASVAGTFGTGLSSYNPNKKLSIAHFHGTSDSTIFYAGGNYGIGADSLTKFWANNDVCNLTPVHTNLPNTKNDGYTVEHYIYSGGQNGTEVELFKVNGADHVWLTNANDISYTVEIWKFFNKHKTATSIVENSLDTELSIYPNPTNDLIHINFKSLVQHQNYSMSIYDITGQLVVEEKMLSKDYSISLSSKNLAKGVYTLNLKNDNINISRKIILVE